MFQFSKQSRDRLIGVDEYMIEIMRVALERSPIDFGIPLDGGLRTVERQKELYAQGRTKPGKIITKTDGVKNKSNHQSGKAVDIYAWVDGKPSWESKYMYIIAGVVLSTAKEMGMEVIWGGTFGSKTWDGWDKAHFELKY